MNIDKFGHVFLEKRTNFPLLCGNPVKNVIDAVGQTESVDGGYQNDLRFADNVVQAFQNFHGVFGQAAIQFVDNQHHRLLFGQIG